VARSFRANEEAAWKRSYFVDSGQESAHLPWTLVESADFPYELEGGFNLWGGNWRIKVEKCF